MVFLRFSLCRRTLSLSGGGLVPSSLVHAADQLILSAPSTTVATETLRVCVVFLRVCVFYCWGLVAGGEMRSNQTCYWGVGAPPPSTGGGERVPLAFSCSDDVWTAWCTVSRPSHCCSSREVLTIIVKLYVCISDR